MYRSKEKGMSTMELTLSLPLVVFALLFLIGMGYALMTKSFVIIGAQYAGNYQRIFNNAPTRGEVGDAVSREWEAIYLSGGAQDGEIHFTASSMVHKGLLAQKYHPGWAAAQYYTVTGTGICPSGTLLTPCITYQAR